MSEERTTIEIVRDLQALIPRAAERIIQIAQASVTASGRFCLALAGGSTPRPVYEHLAEPALAPRIPWAKTHVFWGDERAVPPDDPASNYRMAASALLERVPLSKTHVQRIRGEDPAEQAALGYEQTLRAHFQEPLRVSFDLALLGVGTDGHVASLFPGTAAVRESVRWVLPNQSPVPPEQRITLTPVVLNRSAHVLFLVSGPEKAEPVARILEGLVDIDLLPAQAIRPVHGTTHWLLDEAAAANLTRP
jgi:6-phosphogluconolactonase